MAGRTELRVIVLVGRYWVPVWAYAGVIFYLSSLPHPEQALPSFVQLFSDKALHAMEYALLGGLCYRAFRWGATDAAARHALWLAIAAASLYGIGDEVHQASVPFRDSSWIDWVADTVGAAMGTLALHRLQRVSVTPPGGAPPQALRQP